MTDREKYILACNFAIMQLTGKGSCSVALDVNSDNPIIVYWNDVLEWLDKEYQEEQEQIKPEVEIDLYSVIKQKYIERDVLDKIREQIKSYLRGVEITLEVLVESDPLRPKMEGAKDTLEECLEFIDKAETENKDGEN